MQVHCMFLSWPQSALLEVSYSLFSCVAAVTHTNSVLQFKWLFLPLVPSCPVLVPRSNMLLSYTILRTLTFSRAHSILLKYTHLSNHLRVISLQWLALRGYFNPGEELLRCSYSKNLVFLTTHFRHGNLYRILVCVWTTFTQNVLTSDPSSELKFCKKLIFLLLVLVCTRAGLLISIFK